MPNTKPNMIVIMTDDQGYGDLSCMGATDFRTPHLDALASRGVRFTNWYSGSPVCSPSRACLLTGRYPGNAGVRSILAGHRTATGLPREVPTIAMALAREGYRTAMLGKWHLGLAEGSRPQEHGFQEWFGFMAGCIDYFSHIYYWGQGHGQNPLHDLWENGQETWRNGEYFTDMITARAVSFLRSAAHKPEPFFLYLAYNAPHYPMHAPAAYMERFADLPPDRRVMAAMISAVDDGVGAVVAELARQGILENTAIFFQSDNGPSREARNWLDGRSDPYYGGTTGILRGHKFSLFEGGIRVPGILSWPAGIPQAQVLHAAGHAADVFPTLLAAAALDAGSYELDGQNLLPWLRGETSAPPERDLYWEMGQQTAVRRDNWKLVLGGQEVEGAPPEDAVHLSDLSLDPGERHNLTAHHPARTAELREAAEAWRIAIEERWEQHWKPLHTGSTGQTSPKG